MRKQFNCPRRHEFQTAFAPCDQDEASELEQTDESDDSTLPATASEGEVMLASDEEQKDQTARFYSCRRKECFVFLDKQVCSRAFPRLLGIGQKVLQQLRDGQEVFTNKCRPPIPKHPSFGFSLRGDAGAKWASVVVFLWMIYHSTAECLPTDFVSGFKNSQNIKDEECMFPTHSAGASDDAVLRSVTGFLRSLHQYNSDIEAHMIGPGFFKGERRHLPHGSRTELFFEYRAYCKAVGQEDPASFATFNRIASKVLAPHMQSGYLHFRKPSEHAVCDVCTRLKRSLRFRRGVMAASGGSAADADAVASYTSHILHQWLDRQVYWSLRTISQAWFRRENELADRPLGKVEMR